MYFYSGHQRKQSKANLMANKKKVRCKNSRPSTIACHMKKDKYSLFYRKGFLILFSVPNPCV
jgi:hypothetical protein